jgi:hypothetical protein
VHRILESAGYDVITAPCCCPVAMDVFHNTDAGLVVLDVCLPRNSDQDLCRQIRGNSVLDRFLPELSKKQELIQQMRQEESIRRFDPGPCSKSSIAHACAGAFSCYGFTGSSVVLRIRSLFPQVVDCRRRSFLRHPALPRHTRDISSSQSGQGPISH